METQITLTAGEVLSAWRPVSGTLPSCHYNVALPYTLANTIFMRVIIL